MNSQQSFFSRDSSSVSFDEAESVSVKISDVVKVSHEDNSTILAFEIVTPCPYSVFALCKVFECSQLN